MIKFLNKILRKTGSKYRLEKSENNRILKQLTNNKFTENTVHYLKNDGNSVFFGYHDKTPFSEDNTKILANSLALNEKERENKEIKMDLGYFENINDEENSHSFVKVSETTTWNWQQGCMLQWNPLNSNSEIIFNKIIDGKYGSIIYNIDSKKVIKKFNIPIYSVDPTGRYASSLNFSRLGRIRAGYGYKNLQDNTAKSKAPEDDGVWLIDMKTGEIELIIDLAGLSKFTVLEKEHYINHITFSPNGKYLAFFHFYGDDRIKRINRFYLYDIQKKEFKLLEASRTVSHYCWRNDYEIITTENGPGGCLYYIYNLNKETKKRLTIPNIGDLHPMVSPVNSDIIVADSRPDRKRFQHLFLFNITTNKYKYLGRFYSPNKFTGSFRCDLHPRWDRNGEHIILDTASEGIRNLAIVDLTNHFT